MFANLGVRPGEIHWYYYPGIVGHYMAFFGGVFFMVSWVIDIESLQNRLLKVCYVPATSPALIGFFLAPAINSIN
jgi:hypothetical protein